MKKLLIAIVCLAFTATASAQSQDTSYRPKLRELMELTNVSKLAFQMVDQLMAQMMASQVSEDLAKTIVEEFKKEMSPAEFQEFLLPIYEKYYTKSDVEELLKFYRSPIGKKTISVMPLMAQESMKAGQVWGAEIGQRVVKRLQDNGTLPKAE